MNTNPPIDHPLAQELQTAGHARTQAQTAFEQQDRHVRELIVRILKDDPDQRREDLAQASGLGVDVVKRLAQAAGIPTPRAKAKTKERNDFKIARAIQERPQATTAELAAATGFSPQRITAYLREHGLAPRPQRKAGS